MGADKDIKREAVFQPEFLEDLEYWVGEDREVFNLKRVSAKTRIIMVHY